MTVRTALGIINQVLDEVLAEQEGEFDADTRWALAWFEQFGMDEGPFGVAETLSKAKNTSVNGLVEAGFLKAQGGKVSLLRREELPMPMGSGHRQTVNHVGNHAALDPQAGTGRANRPRRPFHKLGGMAETARDLAYRLYSICERKKWAHRSPGLQRPGHRVAGITKLAIGERTKTPAKQSEMFRFGLGRVNA